MKKKKPHAFKQTVGTYLFVFFSWTILLCEVQYYRLYFFLRGTLCNNAAYEEQTWSMCWFLLILLYIKKLL